MPLSELQKSEIVEEADSRGISEELLDGVLDSIDAAGWDLTPKVGGDAVALTTSVTPVIRSVAGRPGHIIVELTLPSEKVVSWLEYTGADGTQQKLVLTPYQAT